MVPTLMDYGARTKIALVNNFIGGCTNNHVHVHIISNSKETEKQ